MFLKFKPIQAELNVFLAGRLQIFLGPTTLLALLATTQSVKSPEQDRKRFYAAAATLTIIDIFAMRCNVVIGGQLFSVTVHDRS